jgi:hypothetical protein
MATAEYVLSVHYLLSRGVKLDEARACARAEESGHLIFSLDAPCLEQITARCNDPLIPDIQAGDSRAMMLVQGPSAWDRMHRAALHGEPSRFRGVVDGIIGGLPCGECAIDARAFVGNHPPPKGGNAEQFEWSWRFHNAVNRKLGKPELNIEAAARLYQS